MPDFWLRDFCNDLPGASAAVLPGDLESWCFPLRRSPPMRSSTLKTCASPERRATRGENKTLAPALNPPLP